MGALLSSQKLVPTTKHMSATWLEDLGLYVLYRTVVTYSSYMGPLEDNSGPPWQQKYGSRYYSVLAGPDYSASRQISSRKRLMEGEVPRKTPLGFKGNDGCGLHAIGTASGGSTTSF